MSKSCAEELILAQAQLHFDEECVEILKDCENRYLFEDETELFANLVNFSTAKAQPYQRWVRYREGYSTILVKELLRRSAIDPQKSFVADPMMGSGSTLIASKSEGYDTLGIDINPYCRMITNLKLANPSDEEIYQLEQLILTEPWQKDYVIPDTLPPLSDYFPDENLKDVLKIRDWIATIQEGFVRYTLQAAWFFCLENSSNRKKDGNGLATRPAPVKDVPSYFKEILSEIISDFKDHPLKRNNYYIKTKTALDFNSCVQEFKKETGKELGSVIFSPPYANSFDYFESYKLELLFGELIPFEEFNTRKKELIRNYRICHRQDIDCHIDIAQALCREISIEIPKKEERTGKRDGRTRLMPNMIRGYFMDMEKVIEQIYQALENGGRCYIVVDQSAYVGVIIPTDVVLALLAERIGFTVEKISVCRKAATSGQQLSQYPYLKNSLRESIVCLRK